MLQADQVEDCDLSLTTRLLKQEMLKRDWQVWFYAKKSSFMRVMRPDGKVMELFGSMTPDTSASACLASNNKFISYLSHKTHDIPQPSTYLIEQDEDGSVVFNSLRSSGHKVVVKPLDASHGWGVTTAIQSKGDFAKALAYARRYSNNCLAQAYVENAVDIRLLCINYKLVAALRRIPARVKGDGENTIHDLIRQENLQPHRGHNYTKELNYIPLDRSKDFLGETIHNIPAKGKWIKVLNVANVGSGGETCDITSQLPSWLMALAEKAASISRLPCCGVDVLTQKQPEPTDSPRVLLAQLTEVNKSPSLFIHEKPTHGQSRPVIKTYVDYLAKL